MRIENEGEALTTMHIVLDNPEDQVYVTYRGMTLSIYLSELAPERAFDPRAVEVDVMTEDDLVLTRPSRKSDLGDGLRIYLGTQPESFDRTYLKEI